MNRDGLCRKDKIILTTIEIINDVGFSGLSISTIAQREGITKGAIYRHFNSKQEIILNVLYYFDSLAERIEYKIENEGIDPKKGLLLMLKSYAEWFEEYPPITVLLLECEIYRCSEMMGDGSSGHFFGGSEFFDRLISDGQKQGTISTRFVSSDLAMVIMGIVRTVVFEWRLKEFKFPLVSKIMSITKDILNV